MEVKWIIVIPSKMNKKIIVIVIRKTRKGSGLVASPVTWVDAMRI